MAVESVLEVGLSTASAPEINVVEILRMNETKHDATFLARILAKIKTVCGNNKVLALVILLFTIFSSITGFVSTFLQHVNYWKQIYVEEFGYDERTYSGLYHPALLRKSVDAENVTELVRSGCVPFQPDHSRPDLRPYEGNFLVESARPNFRSSTVEASAKPQNSAIVESAG